MDNRYCFAIYCMNHPFSWNIKITHIVSYVYKVKTNECVSSDNEKVMAMRAHMSESITIF